MKIFPPVASAAAGRSHWTRCNNDRPIKSSLALKKGCPHRIDISSAAKIKNLIKGMSGERTTELRTFRQTLHKAIQSETFNASKIVEKAPAELKAWAEESGTDLEKMLNQWAKEASGLYKKLPSFPYSGKAIGSPLPCWHLHTIGTPKNLRKDILEMGEKIRLELRSFGQAVLEAIQSETFDAAEMAEKAPEGIKSWAEKNGIDLLEMLNQWATKATEIKEKFSAAADSWNVKPSISEQDRSELQSFGQAVLEAIQSETFDAAEMAEKAPEGIKSWAEKNGIDLLEMLNQWATKATEIKEKFSAAANSWKEFWLADSSLENKMLNYLNFSSHPQRKI